MNKIYNRLREDLDHRYSEKILWERDTKRKVELVKQRELLRDDKELLKELKDIRAIYDLAIRSLEQDLKEIKER